MGRGREAWQESGRNRNLLASCDLSSVHLSKLVVSFFYLPLEGSPVKVLRIAPAFFVVLVLFLPRQLRAQEEQQAVAPQLPGCSWNCYHVRLPYGLYVREVADGGSYVILEDGSIWEIRLPQRPVASAWHQGDFVVMTTIGAPVDNFEILLRRGDSDKAEARLAGRDHPPSTWNQE
jgi:hypothetical protein